MAQKTLLIGPAASGKTRALIDDFEKTLRNSEDPLAEDCYFVVPSAEHTERIISLIIQRGVPGFFHRRVTTLDHLISRMFSIADHDVASSVTRYLIIRDLMQEKAWAYFDEVSQSPGFWNLMLGFIAELKESLITAPEFRRKSGTLKKLEPELSLKYEALADLYEQYEQKLAAQGLRDPADAYRLYQEKKKEKGFKKPEIKKIWMDGFFDFTEMQLAYIRELSGAAEEFVITLTLDPEVKRAPLFENVEKTRQKLHAIGFKLSKTSRTKSAANPVLAHVEKHLFNSKALSEKPEAGSSLSILEAVGMEGEIEMIARNILDLHRSCGYRFSDFAILLRRIGDYEAVIRSVFRRYGIPLELHERERLEFSPMIQIIVRMLKIYHEGWRRDDVIEFLKSSYVRRLGQEEKSDEWVAELQQRAMIKGISSQRPRWLEAWEREEESSSGFEEAKIKKLQVLAGLEDRLRKATTLTEIKKEMSEAVRDIFGIFQMADSASEPVRREAASFKHFVMLLEEIEASSANEKIPPENLFERFAERFFRLVELDLYSLHELDKNRVQVYGVSLARQKEYKVVFIAGLLEKRFPAQIREDPVLSDWERSLFNAGDGKEKLKERLPRQNLERYLFYLAVTRASEKLILSYPLLDLEGKEALPSYYLGEVKKLFSGIEEKKQKLARPYPSLEQVVNHRELEMAVMGGLWNPLELQTGEIPLLHFLTNHLLSEKEPAERMRKAFYEVREGLTDPEIAVTGAFRSLEASASSLEEFGKCAFRYFSHRVLKLFDPEEDVNVPRRGTILHDALEHFFREWVKNPELYQKRNQRVKLALQKLDAAYDRSPLILERRYQKDLEREDLKAALIDFLDHEIPRLKESPFQPRFFEYHFGYSEEQGGPAFEIDDGGRKIKIRGKIDRIDVDREGKAGLVLDYKRNAYFDPKKLRLGVALQLPLYLMVMEKNLGLFPAGGELYSVKGREKKGFYHAEAKELFPEISARRMILEEKRFRALLDRTVRFIRKYSREMEEMQIAVKPRDCESFCPYPAVCRIEKWRLPEIQEAMKEEDVKTVGQFP